MVGVNAKNVGTRLGLAAAIALLAAVFLAREASQPAAKKGPQITIYTKPTCPYCLKAKSLLNQKKVHYHEINVAGDPQKRAEMEDRAHGRTTVPQIFIDDRHIGGSDDLQELEEQGLLDPLLN